MLVNWKTVSDVHFDITVMITFRLPCSSTINWCETNHYFLQIIILRLLFAGSQQTQNQRTDAAVLLSMSTPPPPHPVRTEQTAVSELTSEPLSVCVCVPLSLPVCLTDGLFVLLVSVCAFGASWSAVQYRPRTCKKKEGSPLIYFTHA